MLVKTCILDLLINTSFHWIWILLSGFGFAFYLHRFVGFGFGNLMIIYFSWYGYICLCTWWRIRSAPRFGSRPSMFELSLEVGARLFTLGLVALDSSISIWTVCSKTRRQKTIYHHAAWSGSAAISDLWSLILWWHFDFTSVPNMLGLLVALPGLGLVFLCFCHCLGGFSSETNSCLP